MTACMHQWLVPVVSLRTTEKHISSVLPREIPKSSFLLFASSAHWASTECFPYFLFCCCFCFVFLLLEESTLISMLSLWNVHCGMPLCRNFFLFFVVEGFDLIERRLFLPINCNIIFSETVVSEPLFQCPQNVRRQLSEQWSKHDWWLFSNSVSLGFSAFGSLWRSQGPWWGVSSSFRISVLCPRRRGFY